MIKRMPFPISGVILGLFALGNLLGSDFPLVRNGIGVMATVLLVLYIMKVITQPEAFRKEISTTIGASVFCTLPMAIVLLSGYAKPLLGNGAVFLYYAGLLLHMAAMVYFTLRFMFKLNMEQVFASYFIVYVGIATGAVVAPVFDKQALGRWIFYFAFAATLILLILVTLRYTRYKEIAKPAQLLFCIYTAPMALSLAGYMQSFPEKSFALITFMVLVSQALYFIVISRLIRYIRYEFFPSCAAFTFPYVISALSLKMAVAYYATRGIGTGLLNGLVLLETIVAALLTFYVLVRYLRIMMKGAVEWIYVNRKN